MPTATAPPLIAPGITCPKCKGPMLDERASKRSDKSPDYTCANMTCVAQGANGKSYRTAIWAEKSSGAENGSAGGNQGLVGTMAGVPSAESVKPKMREAYKQLTEWVISDIAPLYGGVEYLDAPVIASITATLFIQACKSGKVE